MGKWYRYLECGLDYVYLVSGFDYHDGPNGRTVSIHNEEGLLRAIGKMLVAKKHRLTGKEFRYLRTGLLLSQSSLAHIIGVKELTVARWEKGETEIPLATDAVLRTMYSESMGENKPIRELLEKIADLEEALDEEIRLTKKPNRSWAIVKSAA